MASTGEAGLGHASRRPELDGVRGVAILLVLVGHAFADQGYGSLAGAGVTLFFALSGYLITGILVAEVGRSGRIELRRFYARRLTRLAPPLLALLGFVAVTLRPGDGALLASATWTANYASLVGVELGPLGHTWSLAVEEQFYLIWPVALLAILRRPRPLATLGLIVAALFAWRLWLTFVAGDLYYAYSAAETAGVSILAGCLVALARWRLSAIAATAAAVGLVALGIAASLTLGFFFWLLIPIAAAPLACVVLAGAREVRWLRWSPLRWLGVASYSLYLWHEPISHALFGELTSAGVLAGSVIGAGAWWLLERPLMAWRSGRKRRRPDAQVSERGIGVHGEQR